ncbi:MAG: hypothetical protein AAGA91_16030 [Pseudomonadota bacterium]
MDEWNLPDVSRGVPWHASTIAKLVSQVEQNQLGHALLLEAGRHSGGSLSALALARLLLCHAPEGGLNCGRCAACELSRRGAHGDFRWIAPQDNSRVIKVDQVRQAIDFLAKTAAYGRRKVLVFESADSMNQNAFNALLKSLEEPPAGSFLLLLASRAGAIPATVRSRCQLVKLSHPDREASLDWLQRTMGDSQDCESLLEVLGEVPLLIEELLKDGRAESVLRRRQALHGVLSGTSSVSDATELWRDQETGEFLLALADTLQARLRTLGSEGALDGRMRAGFSLLDELLRLQRALETGANPSRELIVESLLAKSHMRLGVVG